MPFFIYVALFVYSDTNLNEGNWVIGVNISRTLFKSNSSFLFLATYDYLLLVYLFLFPLFLSRLRYIPISQAGSYHILHGSNCGFRSWVAHKYILGFRLCSPHLSVFHMFYLSCFLLFILMSLHIVCKQIRLMIMDWGSFRIV